MQKTYLFYDLETSGLNPCFDQVLQFAAIRTTLDLEEIDRYQLTVKLNPDVIPSPSALITHRIPIAEWLKGMPEFEAIQKIHAWMNTPGTLSLGYNTLNFDDEFLRFSFYRNLLPPYTHQYANQCGRLDVFPMTALYFLYQKEALSWPKKDGKTSLKLEYLNEENGFYEGRAHDAMVDVEVTLRLARRLFQYPEMWNYAIGYFDKQQDQQRILKLPETLNGCKEALVISPEFGSQQHFQSVVVNLGSHAHYKNQTLWLRLDRPELSNITLETIPQNSWVLRKRVGEPYFLLPLKERFTRFLDQDVLEIIENNRQYLIKHPDLFQSIGEYHRHYQYPEVAKIDVDASLYQAGFWEAPEKTWSQRFQNASTQQKIDILEAAPTQIMKEQAIRILGRYCFEALPSDYQAAFSLYLGNARSADYTLDYRGKPRVTPEAAVSEIAQLRAKGQLDDEQIILINDLEQYIQGDHY